MSRNRSVYHMLGAVRCGGAAGGGRQSHDGHALAASQGADQAAACRRRRWAAMYLRCAACRVVHRPHWGVSVHFWQCGAREACDRWRLAHSTGDCVVRAVRRECMTVSRKREVSTGAVSCCLFACKIAWKGCENSKKSRLRRRKFASGRRLPAGELEAVSSV